MQINKIAIGVRDPTNSRLRLGNRSQQYRSLVWVLWGAWEDFVPAGSETPLIVGFGLETEPSSAVLWVLSRGFVLEDLRRAV